MLQFASVKNCHVIGGRKWTEVGAFSLQVRGNQLRILSATPEDSGDYICRVQGNTGNPVPHVHQSSVSVSVTSSSSRKSASGSGSILRWIAAKSTITEFTVRKCFSWICAFHQTELHFFSRRGNWSWWQPWIGFEQADLRQTLSSCFMSEFPLILSSRVRRDLTLTCFP